MRIKLLPLLCLTFSAPAWAGPAGAVHCQAPDQSRTLAAYDIAVREPHAQIIVFHAHSNGRLVFQMKNYQIKPEVLELTEQVATIRYVKPSGQNAEALVAEGLGSRIATIEKIKFFNHGLQGTFQRQGSVTVYLNEGPTTELIYKDCSYQGGLVANWEELWSSHGGGR